MSEQSECDKPEDNRSASSKYWSPIVSELTPYVPGEQPKIDGLVKLNTNENPYPPSPDAIAAMRGELNGDLRLYPDPDAGQLKAAIAECHQVPADWVFVGNGSDEVLAHTFFGLLKHEKPLLFPDVTYSFYPVYCGLYGIDYRQVPLDDDFQINVADYAQGNGGVIFPNPNAPTGRVLSLAEITRLLEANTESVVVVDEAYIDFGGDSAVALAPRFPNLLVIQTLSKSRSLAGMRVGYAIAQPGLIDGLERVKNSFNSYPLDKLAIAGSVAALKDKSYFERIRRSIIESREQLAGALGTLGFEVLPSSANFLFVRHPQHDGANLARGLRREKVIVRHFNLPRIEQFLRITVGTEQQNQALLTALEKIIPSP